MNVRAIVIGLTCVGLLGCPKKEDPGVKAEGDAGPTVAASATPEAGTDAGAGATTGTTKGGAFTGKYTVSAATMYVPAEKDWASVKFKNDDSKLLGDGELTLTIDGSGRVSGSSEAGPLSGAVFDGTSDGATLTATIRRKDPKDNGLTGTLVAKISGDKVEGTMNLAEFNAAVVRAGTFSATKK